MAVKTVEESLEYAEKFCSPESYMRSLADEVKRLRLVESSLEPAVLVNSIVAGGRVTGVLRKGANAGEVEGRVLYLRKELG